MRYLRISRMWWVMAGLTAGLAAAAPAGSLRAWGQDSDGQVTHAPTGSDFVAIAAGDGHGLALRSNGTIMAWGLNSDGQCDVPGGTFKAIGAGADFSLGVRTDGSLAAWGKDTQGQVSRVPRGNDFVAVDGGEFFAVALRSDGSLAAWGNDRWGQVSDTPRDKGFTMVVAGDDHAVALRSDGSLVCWGYWGATDGTPTGGAYVALGAGGGHSVALKSDGSLVWWGEDLYDFGLAHVPVGTDFVAVASGYMHGLALRRDGSAVGWGAGIQVADSANWGQASPPAGNDYKALAGGLYFSLALTGDLGPDGGDTDDGGNSGGEPNEGGAVLPVLADDFNDNSPGDLWQLYAADPCNCWLEEVNQRLELRAITKAAGVEAWYVDNDWQIDPTSSFSFRVNWHFGPVTEQAGWVVVGLTPDINDLNARHVEFQAGCDKTGPYLWYEAVDTSRKPVSGFTGRRENDGVLYVSYDAALDELYLSSVAYGAGDAWATIPGLLATAWKGASLRLFLGGGSTGLQIDSGDAWLDDFVVDTGDFTLPTVPGLVRVYRFWSAVSGRHFYTCDEAEGDKLINEYADYWTFEGPAFQVANTPYLPGLAPVYRFWSDSLGSHLYTIDEAEKDKLIRESAKTWTFEGPVFYAYPEGQQPQEAKPVYKLVNLTDGDYFYTISESEKDKLVKEYASIFKLEGIAFYAYDL
jgi:hypothetical protein